MGLVGGAWGVGVTSATPAEQTNGSYGGCVVPFAGLCYWGEHRQDGSSWHGGEVQIGVGVFLGAQGSLFHTDKTLWSLFK